MIVAGKCPPEPEELEKAAERGFDNIELYLEKKHLDEFEETVENCRNAGVEVVSVHTPHVSMKERDYLRKADKLSQKFDAFLVVHSQFFHHVHIPDLEEIGFNERYGYENNPGNSLHHLKKTIINQGHCMVLDTAHFFMSTENFQEEFRSVLQKWSDQIGLIHLCDSTELEDGLGFGEGQMDMQETIRKLEASEFDGIVVLEVMPGDQKDALEKWRSVTV